MKSLQESLFDKDLTQKDIIYHPHTKDELIDCIREQLDLQGPDANLNIIDVSKITDMQSLFWRLNLNLGNIDISNWNVSNVKEMCDMFYRCENFNSDLSKWDVSNVKDMSGMFSGCKSFNSDLSNWDVSNVKDISRMFDGCWSFNSDLSNWDVSNVKDMNNVFYGCRSLKKIPSWRYEKS